MSHWCDTGTRVPPLGGRVGEGHLLVVRRVDHELADRRPADPAARRDQPAASSRGCEELVDVLAREPTAFAIVSTLGSHAPSADGERRERLQHVALPARQAARDRCSRAHRM
jgi:hypothetical protein